MGSSDGSMDKLQLKATRNLLQLPLLVGALIFLPAGTLDYWQAWLFTIVFFACSLAITVYLALKDPELLERRMRAGPGAETEPAQKIIMVVALLSLAALPVVSAIDYRLGGSQVPSAVVILGDVLIIIAYLGIYFVFRENSYSAATIQIAEGQKVISTGPYAVIRHPMYSWALLMLLGIPLALGSWFGLLMLVPAVAGIVWRLQDEERFLAKNLPGYSEYRRKVQYRLLPFVW
jgi:protein-S-isoprenylcysteine O-methyltransferase Ste14